MKRRCDIWQVVVRSGCVLLWVVTCAAADGGTAVVSSVADRLQLRSTIVSSDSAFAISAPPASLGFRGPVLFFVDQFRKEFVRTTQLNFMHGQHPITIMLGNSTNDLRVIGSCAAAMGGGMQEWIELPDPEHASFDQLRTALAQAMVREWIRAQPRVLEQEQQTAQPPPVWLLAGVARHVGAGCRAEDFDIVHAQWRLGRLPSLAKLLSSEPPAALQHPAMQAVLADWLLDQPGALFSALLRRLSSGTPWSAALIAELMGQKTDAALNEAWEAWLVSGMREIKQVGVTTPELVLAFRAQIMIYPGDYGLPLTDVKRGRSMEECLDWPKTPAAKEALRNKAISLRLFAAGRDGTLQRVAGAYAAFLEAVAAGEAVEKLRTMLAQAEEGHQQLEARVQQGGLLRDPVAEPTLPARKLNRK